MQYAKRRRKKEAESGERNLCMVQGILILINLDYGQLEVIQKLGNKATQYFKTIHKYPGS